MNTYESASALFRPPNPRQRASALSALTFWYTIPIFKFGWKHEIDEDDLPEPLEEHESGPLGDKISKLWIKELLRAKRKRTKPSLSRVLLIMFRRDLIIAFFVVVLMEFVTRLFQPLFVGLLIRHFTQTTTEVIDANGLEVRYMGRVLNYFTPQRMGISEGEAYFFATGVFLTSFITVLLLHPYMMATNHTGMKMRVAITSLIYRKVLRLDLTSLTGDMVGNVVTLASSDTARFENLVVHLHHLWASPCQYFAILYFLYKAVGNCCFYGSFTVLFIIPLQSFLGVWLSLARMNVARKTDIRVRLMNEIIRGIQVIKMYGWEYPFMDVINESRRVQVVALKPTVFIKGITMSFILFTTRSAIFFTILCYILSGQQITSDLVFYITAYYQIVRQTMSVFFPQAVANAAEAVAAIYRIEEFLALSETQIDNPSPLNVYNSERKHFYDDELLEHTTEINLMEVTAKYGNVICLDRIDLTAKAGELTILIGAIGAGKTCLLHVILGEIDPFLGLMVAPGTKSFASQEPWLFEASVRQNIVFGHPFDKMRYKTVLKVCSLNRDISMLPYGDFTIVGDRGVSLSGGQRARINLARAVYKDADIYLLDDPLSAVDTHVGKTLFDQCILGFLNEKVVILATHQLQFVSKASQVVLLEDGQMLMKGTFDELKDSGFRYAELLKDDTIINQVDEEHERTAAIYTAKMSRLSLVKMESSVKTVRPPKKREVRSHGSISGQVYRDYIFAGGNWCLVIFLGFMFLLVQLFASGVDYFTGTWVMFEEKTPPTPYSLHQYLPSREVAIWVYTFMIIGTAVVAISRAILFFQFCLRASIKLHNMMFNQVCRARMSFFVANQAGVILNRFSKDLGAVDEFLPTAMIDTFQITLNLVGTILVLLIVHVIFVIHILAICIIFYFLRKFYIRTSRSVKRLEGVTKSPVLSHIAATLMGLETIRAHNQEFLVTAEFDSYQDVHSSAYFYFMCTSRAFGYWMDVVCAFLIGIITYTFLFFNAGTGAAVGLGITQCIGQTGLFQWGMKQSAELENQMTSVERVLEFTKIDKEPELISKPGKGPPWDWPQEGRIVFNHTTMYYNADAPPILKDITLTIEPHEKIGIVGRTGAGKSSLMSALFRLTEFEGTIHIDNVDISKLGLHDLRKKIAVIPQEPLIFSGTLRYNVDPFHVFPDVVVMNVLLEVEIKAARLYGPDCLHIMLLDGGANLSVGQRQLICLARAILLNNKILVMDEATASMDPETDKFLQTIIRKKFRHCTVITIAHRLHTIIDSDRVVVLDAGQILEVNHPHVLLQNPKGVFTGMVDKTGTTMSRNLKNIAQETYAAKFPNSPILTTTDETPEDERTSLETQDDENQNRSLDDENQNRSLDDGNDDNRSLQ